MRDNPNFIPIVKILIFATVGFLLLLLSLIGAFSPLYNVSDLLTRNIRSDIRARLNNFNETIGVIGNVYTIKNERDELLVKIAALENENTQLKTYEEQIKVLEEQLGTSFSKDFELVACEIISLDPKEEGRATVNKGSSDDIGVGDILVLNNSALGEVVKVNNHTSDVILITSPASNVPVISQTNGTRGIMKGEFGSKITVNNILQTDKLEQEESFITLGTNSNYPSGLFVGRVGEINEIQAETKKSAVLTNPINFRTLRYVFILKIEKD